MQIVERLQQLHANRQRLVIQRIEQVCFEAHRLQALCRQLETAIGRGWSAATGKVLETAECILRDAPHHSSEANQAIAQASPQKVMLGDVLAELRQCQEEFGSLQFSPEGPSLSITTDAIELEDTYLGEFQIELDLSRLTEPRHGSIYRIIALDPHPACSNNSVTHPHVSDERLCEGDASAAIGAALACGRLFDFFSLVKGVLATYNPNSPYVSLNDWSGVSCHDCGYTTDPDELHYCSSCEEDYCGECISYCRRCDEGTCRGCLEECNACGELVCPSCKLSCPECGRLICNTCHEEQQCTCVQELQESKENEDERDIEIRSATGDSHSADGATECVPSETA